MHLLKRFFVWLLQPVTSNELLGSAEHNEHYARDVGISIRRIRLPSGAEIVLVDSICEAETIRDPKAEGHADLPSVEATTFIHGKTGP